MRWDLNRVLPVSQSNEMLMPHDALADAMVRHLPRKPCRKPAPFLFCSFTPKISDLFLSETGRADDGSSLPKMLDFICVCLNCPATVPALLFGCSASVPKILFPVLRVGLSRRSKSSTTSAFNSVAHLAAGAASLASFFEPKMSDSMCFFLFAADCSNSDVPKMLLLWPPGGACRLEENARAEQPKDERAGLTELRDDPFER